MRKSLILLYLSLYFFFSMALPAMAQEGCTEPLPVLFKRVSASVVFISAVGIDPFKLNDRVNSSIGSGFIISDDGLILTNSHVVFGRGAISVALDDGKRAQTELLGADPILDLAVIRILKPPENLPKATLGDSDKVQVGEDVVAIGNPFGLEQTLTRGVVSGLNRIISTSPMSRALPFIQTDAAINPGNSGGPLLNRCGEVIGINTAGFQQAQSIGFAVPINIAIKVLPQLLEHGRIIRPWFGVNGKLIGKDLQSLINVPLVDGFLVETVEPGSPAHKAGVQGGHLPIKIGGEELLLGGDIITAANGKSVDMPEEFMAFVRSLKVGDDVRLSFIREGKTLRVEFKLPERPILPGDLPSDSRSALMPFRSRKPFFRVLP